MGNFIKVSNGAKIRNRYNQKLYKRIRSVCLPICMFSYSSSISYKLCLARSLFSEAMLHFIKYVQFSEVFSQARSNTMLQYFAQDASQ